MHVPFPFFPDSSRSLIIYLCVWMVPLILMCQFFTLSIIFSCQNARAAGAWSEKPFRHISEMSQIISWSISNSLYTALEVLERYKEVEVSLRGVLAYLLSGDMFIPFGWHKPEATGRAF